jgi:hypothetical protein
MPIVCDMPVFQVWYDCALAQYIRFGLEWQNVRCSSFAFYFFTSFINNSGLANYCCHYYCCHNYLKRNIK